MNLVVAEVQKVGNPCSRSLNLPDTLQDQPHGELIAIVHLGGDQGMSNCDHSLAIQEQV